MSRAEAAVRLRLFWRISLTYLGLLVVVLLAVDFYVARTLRNDYLRASFDQLEALAKLALAQPPRPEDPAALRTWAEEMARSGARVSVIAADGRVLADSAEDPQKMENHAGRPEVQQALASGAGRAVRHSATIGRDLVYLALRSQPSARPPLILRFALPLRRIDDALAEFRRRLVVASMVILLAAGGAMLLISRSFSGRVGRLKDFSRRVAGGDFHPLSVERGGDELTELAQALNETAVRLDQTIRSLTDERNRSDAIVRSMVEGVAVVGPNERILFCNPAFGRILGVNAKSFEGRPLVEVSRQTELLEVVRKASAARGTVAGEVVLGTVRPQTFAVTAAPVQAGETSGAVVVLHDISELRRLERVRRDFVANVSHELKTPLTAIQGFAETLLGGALDDLQNRQRFVEIIRDHARRLARLTDDLLRLSQMEAGKLELELRPLSVARVIESCVETTSYKAAEKQLTVQIECPQDLPPVRGDVNRLQDVLQNLLDNAVQYTPPGGRVTVRAQAAGREVIVTVSDTGIGIPRADQERIFERFYRVDVARSREAGGTGLGLAIAKHLVEAHGGRIWVESSVGQGSDFHFSIPAAALSPLRQSRARPSFRLTENSKSCNNRFTSIP
jgi:two-component system phosphate regulon sensor histidine kinase PhoR